MRKTFAAMKNLAVLLVATLVLFNCGEYQGQTADPQRINFKQVEKAAKDGDCDNQKSNYCAEIKIEYPVCVIPENRNIEKKINKYVKSKLMLSLYGEEKMNSFDDIANEFFDEYSQFKIEVPDSYQEWSIERIANVKFFNDDFISFTFSEYSYLGGAHPNSYTMLAVLDLKNGNKLKLEDILIKEYKPILNKIAEKEFRKLKEIEENESLDEAGFWFDDNQFSINDNFALSDEGLTFYYNSYEITAYAYGPTELIISLAKISEIIKKNGILAEFMKQ